MTQVTIERELLEQAIRACVEMGMERTVQKLRVALQAAPAQPERPINCGTGHCSCIECVMEPAQPDEFRCPFCFDGAQAYAPDQPAQGLTDALPPRDAFEKHWLETRGKKKAFKELQRDTLQPQCYVQDNANRHWVTWQASRAAIQKGQQS